MAKPSNILDYATSLDPIQAQMLAGKQVISETKYDTLTLAAAAVPATTQFFAASSADLAIKNFDGNGILVSSGKYFLAQTLGILITDIAAALTAQNIYDVLHKCAVRIQVDSKIMGTFPVHQLTGFGGAYLPSQVAVTSAAPPAGAVANFGIANGVPQNQPFRLKPMLIEGQKNFSAFLIGPTGSAITLAGTMGIKMLVGGLQFQAIQ
jgi:hypothetical protein